MAPVYDLVRSKYAPTLVAGCFAAALLVLAVMVASTSAGVGGQLRRAASPAESRTVVEAVSSPASDGEPAPLLRTLVGPQAFGVMIEPAVGGEPAAPEGGAGTGPATPTSPPAEPAAPAEPVGAAVGSTAEDTQETVAEVVDGLTAILDSLSTGVNTAGVLP